MDAGSLSPSRCLEELAEVLAREPGAQVEAGKEGLRIIKPQMVSDLVVRELSGVGELAGSRRAAVAITTVLRGNVALSGSARMRAYRLNPRSAIGAVQAERSAGNGGLSIGSRICVDSEVPWQATGRHLVRLAVMEAGLALFDEAVGGSRQLDRAGIGVWRNCLQSVPGIEPEAWRVVHRAADTLTAQLIHPPAVRGVRVALGVSGRNPLVGRGFGFVLQLPRQFDDGEALAALCDALNAQESLQATGSPHIGAWSATAAGYCRYQVSVPARLGRRLPDLPRQLLEGAGARAGAALALQQGL